MAQAKSGLVPWEMELNASRIAYLLDVNGRRLIADVEGDTALLSVLHEEPGLALMPFRCSAGLCGACTIAVDGVSVRACSFPVAEALGRRIETISRPDRGAFSRADRTR